MPQGATQNKALDTALTAIRNFAPDALVVSLGFDMATDDPLAAVQVHSDGFAEMARRLAALNLPTILVQEGEYLRPSLADNAKAFLTPFREATA